MKLIKDGPHILNKHSKFVMVTYWWGRGRINKNFQRPCRPTQKRITREGIPFEDMIKRWTDNMKKLNINYYAVEIPELSSWSVQKGINYKPDFILSALDAVFPRAAVYLDGDIYIHKFPYMFELDSIDFMAHGWNDGESRTKKGPCWDPFVSEISGGIMYAGNTPSAKKLFNRWIEETNKPFNKGKADDRILSFLINKTSAKAWCNIFELPKEYLWLTFEYSEKQRKTWRIRKSDIIIEHTECLTEEEIATEEGGAAKDRIPRQYNRFVEDRVVCLDSNPLGDSKFLNIEYMYMTNKYQSKHMRNINVNREDLGYQDLILYKDKWGSLTSRIEESKRKIILLEKKHRLENNTLLAFNSKSKIDHYKANNIAQTILRLKNKYSHFIYVSKVDVRRINKLIKMSEDYVEFSAKNDNTSKERYKKDYLLQIDKSAPIYFSFKTNNKFVPNFVLLWSIMKDDDQYKSLQGTFNSMVQSLQFMRTKWL